MSVEMVGLRWRVVQLLILAAVAHLAFDAPAVAQQRVYVVNQLAGTLSVIDTTSESVVGTIPIFEDPFFNPEPVDVAVSPDGTTAYIANSKIRHLAVVDTLEMRVAARIRLEDQAIAVAVTPNGQRLYATGNPISVIDTATLKVTETIDVAEGSCNDVAFTPDGARAYVADCGGGTCVIDASTNTLLTTIPRVGGDALAITPDGRLSIYTPGDLGLAIVSNDSNTQLAGIALVGLGARDIAIEPSGALAYAVQRDALVVIDIAARAVVDTIPFGENREAVGIAIVDGGHYAYVANHSVHSVSIIDLHEKVVVKDIPVGRGPRRMAVGAFGIGTPTPTARPTCVGDCNGDGQVRVDEIIFGVGIALGIQSLGECLAFDPSGDDAVTIDELILAIVFSLNGCP